MNKTVGSILVTSKISECCVYKAGEPSVNRQTSTIWTVAERSMISEGISHSRTSPLLSIVLIFDNRTDCGYNHHLSTMSAS